MNAIRDSDRGRYEIATADGDLLTIDTAGGQLVSMREGSWDLVSVDQCEMGVPVALTVRDASGAYTPWFGDKVLSIRKI